MSDGSCSSRPQSTTVPSNPGEAALPAVSVVLPVYNGERYLAASIESVLVQTYEHFEFVIWDDASRDASREIVARYRDPRLRVYENHSNLGLFPTLNRTIRQSVGTYVKLWTQDDIMKPDCLKTHVEFHQRHPNIGMSCSSYENIDSSGAVQAHGTPFGPSVFSPEEAARVMFYFGSIAGNISTVMVERRILDDVGLFREDMTFAGDFDRWVAICKHYPIGSIKETLVYLRDHNGQLSRKKGHYVSDMRECVPIYQELMERLPLEERAYAKRYLRRYTHRMYLHYVMRSLAERDVQTAVQAYRVIREIENLPILAALWLITCNGRFFRLPPRVMCVLRAAENESQ